MRQSYHVQMLMLVQTRSGVSDGRGLKLNKETKKMFWVIASVIIYLIFSNESRKRCGKILKRSVQAEILHVRLL